jgi:hypothetical protein
MNKRLSASGGCCLSTTHDSPHAHDVSIRPRGLRCRR